MRKIKTLIELIIIVALSIIIVSKISSDMNIGKINIRESIHNFMKSEQNQNETYLSAIALNGGNSENTCVYFVSEALRRNNFDISLEVGNTVQLISLLQEKGWKIDKNYKNLRPGDICFTTDSMGNKNGRPSHTYIFMGWVEEGKYDYAYVCDNQANDYNNQIYHKRNIKSIDKANGVSKDAFSFFMKEA